MRRERASGGRRRSSRSRISRLVEIGVYFSGIVSSLIWDYVIERDSSKVAYSLTLARELRRGNRPRSAAKLHEITGRDSGGRQVVREIIIYIVINHTARIFHF